MKIKLSSLLIVSFTLLLSACYYDNLEELRPAAVALPGGGNNPTGCDTAKTITYTTDVKPILSANCGTGNSCHNGSGSQSGIDLATFAGAKASAQGSLIGAITWNGTAPNMPKGSTSKINDCNIAIIKKWAATGYAE